jgi:hypothetical protein
MLPTDPEVPENPKKLAELLRSIAARPPFNPHVDNGPWDFLSRVDAAIRETRVRPVLLELLTDADAVVRDRAIGALMGMPADASTFVRLIDVAEKHPSLLAARVDEHTLSQRIQHALSNLAQDAVQRRRAAKATRGLTKDTLPFLSGLVAQYEPEHLIALARKFPGREDATGFWADAAGRIALYQRDHLLPLLKALAPLAPETKQEIAQALQEPLTVPDATAAAFAAAEGIAVARSTGPTLAECRNALGLS